MKARFLVIVLISQLCVEGFAKRPSIDAGKVIRVKYSLARWNTDSEKIDVGDIVIRDVNTKKNVKFQIEETDPSSGIFAGYYSVDWGGGEPIIPDVYIFPQKQVLTQKDLVQIDKQIEIGKVHRNPILIGRGDDGIQILEVFNTNEEAEEAFRKIQEAVSNKNKKSSALPFVKAGMNIQDTDELKRFADEQENQSEEIEKNQYEGARLYLPENQKEETKEQQTKHTESDREIRAKQAAEFSDAAMDFFKVKKFDEAEKYFKKSFELNPNQPQYYFQYAVTLFRQEKYNEAIRALNRSKGPGVLESERYYYLALAYYKLKEYVESDKTFKEVVHANDKKLSPVALFYRGVIRFDLKKYEIAKSYFQKVIDVSSDPDLDNRAEKKLDEIDAILAFAKNKTKKFILSATLGGQYDSNVILSSNSALDQGSASNGGSPRISSGLGLMWRPIFNREKEFGLKLRTDYIYTTEPELISNDPLIIDFTTPYTVKGHFWGKAVKLDIKPGFESLFLGQTSSGSPQQKLNGIFVDTSASFIMRPDWYLTGTLQIRNDTFLDITDENAFIWKLKASNFFFFGNDNKKAIIAELGYGENLAKGISYQTNRFESNLLYMSPTKWSQFTFTGGLNYYYLNYYGSKVVNNNLNLVSSMSKTLNDWVDMIIYGTFTLNESNSISSMYHKYTLGLLFNMETSF